MSKTETIYNRNSPNSPASKHRDVPDIRIVRSRSASCKWCLALWCRSIDVVFDMYTKCTHDYRAACFMYTRCFVFSSHVQGCACWGLYLSMLSNMYVKSLCLWATSRYTESDAFAYYSKFWITFYHNIIHNRLHCPPSFIPLISIGFCFPWYKGLFCKI